MVEERVCDCSCCVSVFDETLNPTPKNSGSRVREMKTLVKKFMYLSAATVSIVFLIRGYWSSTALK